jgi:hypothetical protein
MASPTIAIGFGAIFANSFRIDGTQPLIFWVLDFRF